MKHRQKENPKSLCQPEKTVWETYFLHFLFFNLEEFGSYGKTHEMYFFLPWSWFYTFIYLYPTSFHKLYFILFWCMQQSSMEQSGILRKSEIYLFQSLPCFLFLIPLSKLLCLTCQGVLWLGSNNSLTSVEFPPSPTRVLPYPLLCWMQGWTLLAHGRPGVQLRPKGGARSFLTRIIEVVAIWMYHGAWYFCGNYLVKAPGPNLTEPEAKLGKHNINTWPDPNSVEC